MTKWQFHITVSLNCKEGQATSSLSLNSICMGKLKRKSSVVFEFFLDRFNFYEIHLRFRIYLSWSQVHHVMCTELMKLVDRVSSVFPEIEATRSRCSTGIQAVCVLNRAIEKANLLLQYCSESSKLYLVCTFGCLVTKKVDW